MTCNLWSKYSVKGLHFLFFLFFLGNTNHSDQEYYIHCLVCFIARCTSSLEMDHRRRKGGRLGG